jgi:hypothetical protein
MNIFVERFLPERWAAMQKEREKEKEREQERLRLLAEYKVAQLAQQLEHSVSTPAHTPNRRPKSSSLSVKTTADSHEYHDDEDDNDMATGKRPKKYACPCVWLTSCLWFGGVAVGSSGFF